MTDALQVGTVDPATVMHLLNDAIIQELLDRVKVLEDRVASLEGA